VVIDARLNGKLGIPFIAFAPFIGIAMGVYLFGKISMAHFNPAVTVGFLITKHITKVQLFYYFTAEILGALLGSLFVKFRGSSNDRPSICCIVVEVKALQDGRRGNGCDGPSL
jgi:glycerol uptake facilitator-like aquaporin